MFLSLVVVLVFLIFLGLALFAFGLALRFTEAQRKRQLTGLLDVITEHIEARQMKVLVENAGRGGQAIRRFLTRLNLTSVMESRMRQGGLDWSLERLLLIIGAAGAIGGFVGFRYPFLLGRLPSMAALACSAAWIPWWYVRRAREKRLALFEAQFPEALDFLARALRAGHALSISLGMLGKESIEPLRTEFGRVYYEHSLGESVPVVLQHLAERVPLVDVQFFVSAVLMQRETGGNLGEVLSRLAGVIRERFRVKGQVRAASAHGRITALVLTLMPAVAALGLTFVAPEYFVTLLRDPDGKYLLFAAAAAQAVGYFIMQRIVNIKV